MGTFKTHYIAIVQGYLFWLWLSLYVYEQTPHKRVAPTLFLWEFFQAQLPDC